MSKVTFEFDSFEDKVDIRHVFKASDYSFIIWNFKQWLRGQYKYEEESKRYNIEDIQKVFLELCEEYGYSDDDIE